MSASPTVVIVPGLRDHVENHWQTHLHRELPQSVCVPRLQVHKLSCRAWVDALDATIAAAAGPVLLVAHSAGVMMVAHWARQQRRAILGALLVTPPDFGVPLPEGYPAPHVLEENGWLPTPMERLPFPSIVAASTNDPLAALDRTVALAQDWGGRVVQLGEVGHLNPAAGFGCWPQGKALLQALLETVA